MPALQLFLHRSVSLVWPYIGWVRCCHQAKNCSVVTMPLPETPQREWQSALAKKHGGIDVPGPQAGLVYPRKRFGNGLETRA